MSQDKTLEPGPGPPVGVGGGPGRGCCSPWVGLSGHLLIPFQPECISQASPVFPPPKAKSASARFWGTTGHHLWKVGTEPPLCPSGCLSSLLLLGCWVCDSAVCRVMRGACSSNLLCLGSTPNARLKALREVWARAEGSGPRSPSSQKGRGLS